MRRLSVVLAVLSFVAPSAARADPLVITGDTRSFLALVGEGDSFRFAGDGFEVSAFTDPFSRVRAASCTFCQEGDLVNVSWRTPGEVPIGSGTARFGENTFADITLRGTLAFDVTPVTFPRATETVVGLRPPFSFAGSLRGFEQDRQVFAADFVGQGDVFASFLRFEEGYVLDPESPLLFAFTGGQGAPIPEPASVLLLGSGLAGTILARQRRRRGSVRDRQA